MQQMSELAERNELTDLERRVLDRIAYLARRIVHWEGKR